LLYASIYDDVPLVVNLASRFDMTRGVRQRFGDEILKKVEEEGKVEVPRVTPEGKVATYTLTKKAKLKHPSKLINQPFCVVYE